MKGKFSRVISVVMALIMLLPFISENTGIVPGLTAYAEDESYVEIQQDDINRDENLPDFVEPEYTPAFSFPNEMRGVYVTPTVHFAVPNEDGSEKTPEEISAEVESMLDTIEATKLNTIIINTDYKGTMFYSTDVNETVKRSVIEYAIEAAKNRGFYVYLTFDINNVLSSLEGMDLQSRIDYLAIKAHSFTVKYPVDGIILEGYYSSKNTQSYDEYMKNGSGIGFDNWLLDNGAYVFSLCADAIRKTNNTVPVGISIIDVWANYTTNESGSDTTVDFEALTDGYADTVSYLEKGYADFVMLRAKGSIADNTIPFNEIMGWWDKHCTAADIPMFANHANEKICTDEQGWSSPDELVKQVIAAKKYASYKGSAFSSYNSLIKNPLESTTVLVKHYNDQVDLEGLNNELEMTLPTSTTFKTEEPSVIFAGSFDPNFSVYFQGKPIKLNEAGRFYFNMELDVGVNTFTFQSKAKIVTYKITRTVNVLKSVSPSDSTMRVEEQSTIALSAIAYKGSTVTASINGKSISLKPVDGLTDELDPNSNYTKYVGQYTAPSGKRGQDIDLGAIKFYGTYPTKTTDIEQSRTGSNIIVNALAEIANDYSGSLLMVNSDNTMVYNYRTTDTEPTPDMARLPAGTLDYCVKTVAYGDTSYYLTQSGKRIKTSAVSVLSNKPLGTNVMSVKSVAKDGTDTVLKLGVAQKIPFAMAFNNVNYSGGDNGSYYISDFTATSLVITFDYVTSVSAGDISFPSSSVFTSGTWNSYDSNGLTKTKLTLNLREQGIFAGVTTTYDSEGNLVFRFNGPRNSVSGATIVIDPGHGYTGKSAFDPGAVGHIKEQSANLAIAKYLEQILTDQGANVIRLKTESQTYVTDQRASIARQYSPDLFISVHCNSASESAYGAEAYYFTPYSQPLAKYVSAAIGSYLSENVHGGGDCNRGAKYNYFFVTQQQDFPSILIESGFVTNYNEAMALADSSHQYNIANAIAKGVSRYFSRCSYSSYGDGSGVAEKTDVLQQTQPAYTEAAAPVENPFTDTSSVPNSFWQTEYINTDDPYYNWYLNGNPSG